MEKQNQSTQCGSSGMPSVQSSWYWKPPYKCLQDCCKRVTLQAPRHKGLKQTSLKVLAGLPRSFLLLQITQQHQLQLCHNLSITGFRTAYSHDIFFFRGSKTALRRSGCSWCSRNETSVKTLQKQWETRKTIQTDSEAAAITTPASSTSCSWLTGLQQFCVRLLSICSFYAGQRDCHRAVCTLIVSSQRPCSRLSLSLPAYEGDFQ